MTIINIIIQTNYLLRDAIGGNVPELNNNKNTFTDVLDTFSI